MELFGLRVALVRDGAWSVEVSIDLSFSSCGREELHIVAIVTEFPTRRGVVSSSPYKNNSSRCSTVSHFIPKLREGDESLDVGGPGSAANGSESEGLAEAARS
jgi:hypothetical protein